MNIRVRNQQILARLCTQDWRKGILWIMSLPPWHFEAIGSIYIDMILITTFLDMIWYAVSCALSMGMQMEMCVFFEWYDMIWYDITRHDMIGYDAIFTGCDDALRYGIVRYGRWWYNMSTTMVYAFPRKPTQYVCGWCCSCCSLWSSRKLLSTPLIISIALGWKTSSTIVMNHNQPVLSILH